MMFLRKVTGLTLKDFNLLVGLGVFNRDLMNDAVYKFKRYEDSSLEYTGINTHKGTVIGGWDTVKDLSEEKEAAPEPEPQTPKESAAPLPTKKSWETLAVGDQVVHKSFGPGEITSLDKNYIVVSFSDRESKFMFPGAFERGFLFVE